MKYISVKLTRSETESVQRDMPPWEIPVLQMVHGPEKVEIVGEKDVSDQEYPEAAMEFDRLSRRYSDDPATNVFHVAAVYGQPPFGVNKLAEEIERARKAEVAGSKKSATTSRTQSITPIDA
jgi:hypothetical protein